MIYVEKEALINKFVEGGSCLSKDQIIYLINRLPTTEIVTCKECVFKNGCNRCVVATLLGDNSVSVKTSDVDFCSNGERSEK